MPNALTLLARGLGTVAKSGALVGGRSPSGFFGPIREAAAGNWQKGITIDPLGSLASYSPVYACVARISGDIAKLGIKLLMQVGNTEVMEPAPKDSPFWRVLRKPNAFQNRIQFIRYWLISKLLFGNTYVLKERDGRGIVTRMYVLDPRRVTPMVTPQGDVYYSLGGDDLSRVPAGMVVPGTEIIHDRGPTLWHPLVGVPPIYACALSGTLGLRIQQNSAVFFENMSRPSGMLSAPASIDDVTAERLKREWNSNYSGLNLGKVAVAGDGLTYTAMTIAAEQSQLVQQLGLTAVDVATAFSMPAYKINQGQMPSNNNVQALDQQYYSACLQVQIEDIELCLDEGLSVPDGYSVEFELGGLLRMDSATQMEVLSKGVGGAILKPDEARAKLGLKPVTGGDTVYLQQQNYSLEALSKRDGKDDPFGKAAAPSPAPAPVAAEPAPAPPPEPKKGIDFEGLLQRSLQDTIAATERAAVAEQQVVQAKEAEASAQREAQQAIERAAQAERQLAVSKEQPDDADDVAAFAAELMAALEELEPLSVE